MNLRLKPNGKKDQFHSRSKYRYFDQAQFVNWVNRLGLEKTFLGRTVFHLEERFSLRRLSIVFLFCFLLAIVLFFDAEFTHTFKAGEIASVDVKSPISFEIVDEVETESKRVQAANAVLPVFDYDSDLYERISNNIYNSFRAMRVLIRQTTWSKNETEHEEQVKNFFQHKEEFEKIFGYTVPDRLFEWLVELGFSARIENMLIRALEYWSEIKIADSPDKVIPKSIEKIIIRTLKGAKVLHESMVSKQEVQDFATVVSMDLNFIPGFDHLQKRHKQNFEKLAQLMVVSNVIPNNQETAQRKKKARDAVLPTVLSLKKNQVILSAGTQVQPIHVTIMREIQNLKSNRRHDFISLVTAILFMVLIMVFFAYIRRFSLNRVKVGDKDVWVMGLVTFIIIILTKLFLFITDAAFMASFGQYIRPSFFLYLAPVAAGPMLIGLLISSGEVVWLFTVFLSIALGIMVDLNFAFLLVALVGGIAAARGILGCKKRNDIYKAGVRTGIINGVMIFLVTLIQVSNFEEILPQLTWNVPAGFLSGIFASMVTMIVVPILESVFNYTTDVRLLELSNLNHPLLKEMLVKVPGTYHHSMMVGNMVEAAAEEIGANPLLAKVMGYYHDIGKIEHASYFIENQRRGHNLHDHISPFMSKTVLIAHVKDGVELGMKYKLGTPIIDGILQHHGTTLISFFYNKALELCEDDKKMDQVSEAEFRYPGPKPQFREAGLLMLADSIEAAARSIDEPTTIRLQNIVHNIIQRKFMDGQLDNCNLTLKDLSLVERAFVTILLGIYHQRIDYPKNAGGGASDTLEHGFQFDPNLSPKA